MNGEKSFVVQEAVAAAVADVSVDAINCNIGALVALDEGISSWVSASLQGSYQIVLSSAASAIAS